jgi:CPA1 family monovalent cation:H+ antiporter
MSNSQSISGPVYEQLRHELDGRLENVNAAVDSILGENQDRLAEELQVARTRLNTAEKSAIEQAMQDGWISANTASKIIDEADLHSAKPSAAPQKSTVAGQ